MLASKIKRTHEEGFLEQLARAVSSGRLDTNQRVTEALKLVHKCPPDAPLSDAEIDEHCGVGLEVSGEELRALVAGVFEAHAAELAEQRYTFSTGVLQVAAVNCDPRMKWASGKDVREEVLRLQREVLGPKTAEDEAMLTANKGKKTGGGKKDKSGKKSKKKKSTGKGGEEGAKSAQGGGESKGDGGAANKEASTDNMFTNRARFPKTAFNSKEAVAAHRALTGGKIRTRFPPEPNGYLHIGHAKSMVLNFEWAFQELGVDPGDTFLRFDDTNPKAESKEFIDNIIENVTWLGWKPCDVTHSSDHFQALYDFGERLITQGDAFVCDQTAEEMKACKDVRRELATPEEIAARSKDYMSPHRDRPVEESLQLFRDMRDGKYDEGALTMRLKMDWASPFPVMWDTVAYRIIKHPHPHTGDKWVIYPTYDYTHCIIDSLEHIDYSLCTLEFEARRDSYYWLVDKLAPPLFKSLQFEFSRLNIEYAQLSKRRLKLLVDANHVNGWDDPRLFTINGLRRRGFTSEGINNFIRDVG
jgi:glutaminyl-tRNA synthetase